MQLLATLALLCIAGFAISPTVRARTIEEDTPTNAQSSRVIQKLLSRSQRSVYKTPPACFKDFFIGKKESTGFHKPSYPDEVYVCQQLPGKTKVYFGSLFNNDYGIPVYSAYLITAANAQNIESGRDRNYKWRTEPGIPLQGTDALYSKQSTYAKGHLLPAAIYGFADDYVESTFTYTNAVPQVSGFNSGVWAQYEKLIKEYAITTCSKKLNSDLYLITGMSEIRYSAGKATKVDMKLLKNKIAIPNSMWTAGCCIDSKGNVKANFAVIGNNFKDKSKIEMTELLVSDLQNALQVGIETIGSHINLFPGNHDCSDKNFHEDLK